MPIQSLLIQEGSNIISILKSHEFYACFIVSSFISDVRLCGTHGVLKSDVLERLL